MTLVINVLHKDFSLLATDRMANAKGPATITTGKLTISMPAGGKIIGYRKLLTTSNGSAAAGIAGTVAEHTYVDAFKAASSAEAALDAVRSGVHSFFDFAQRDRHLLGEAEMMNASITSFFDSEKDCFWTYITHFTRFAHSGNAYVRKENPYAQVYSVGSGHEALARAINGDEITRFSTSLKESWSEMELARWLDKCFKTVSESEPSVSDSYDAVIVTRDNPFFTPLNPGDARAV